MILPFMIALFGPSQLVGKETRACEKTPIGMFNDSRPLIENNQDAASIADVILSRKYGPEKIKKEKPFHIAEDREKYIVEGVLPRGFLGGVARIEICKINAKVIYISHSK